MKVKVPFVSKKNMKGDESMKIKSLLGGVCVVATSLVLPCRADYTCVTNGFAFNYTVNTDGKAIIQYNKGALFKGEELFIPAQLDGRPVISLGKDAFTIVTNSFYETKRGRAFVENGPQEIGLGAFYTDGSGWDVVCVPGSVTRFSDAWCFRTVGKVYWTISSETPNIDQFAFSIAPYEIRIVATCGVPNELHDKCDKYYGRTYYKCKKEHFEAWVARGGLDRFRGYVDDDYVYGEQSLVSFSVEGGEPVPDRTYRQGSPYQSFPTPTKIGYSFRSWRTIPYPEAGQNDGFVVDVDDVVTSPRETLYAEWSPLKPTWTVENTSVTYDGNAHGITVRPIAPVDGVAVTYAETEAGPYTEVSPTLTEAGTKQIWYVLKAPDWTPLTNSATLKVVKLVSNAAVTKTLTSVSYVYSGTSKRPSVVLKDTTALPNLAVTAYSAGDVDGDGQLTENDITLIQRYNAYQKLSVEDKEKFPSYNLTGSALVAADVNKDGIVDANDVTALRAKFSGYELVEGTDYMVAYSDNVNAGTGRVTITGKGNYGGSTVLEFTISKATLGESGEPGSGSQPSDGKSKYDVTCVYDGQGYTVNTNALSSLKINAATMEVAYSLDGAAGWGLEPPVYTNAGQYVIWYRLRNPNYNDYVHEVQLTITSKPISDSSITKTLTPDAFVYDGTGKMPKETIVDESVFRWQFVAPYAHGDVDGDGVLTQEDVNAIDRYLSYLEMDDDLKSFFEEYALTGAALVAADYNGDGVVDEADMTELEASFVTLQKGVDYTITYKNNVNPGTATAIVSGLGNYGGTTTLTFTIVSLEIAIDDGTGGAGGRDSRFSYSGVYDGQGHGIAVEVTSVSEPHIRYALAQEGPYSDSLLLTNACTETAVWYAVSAAGYNTYTNWATVTIAPRPVTLTSGSARKVYDGTPLTAGTVAVGGEGFVADEGATFDVTGSQTAVGTSANTFAYSLNDGTEVGNYEIATVYGTLEVTRATVGPGGDEEPGGGEVPEGGLSAFDATSMYDGEGHTIDTNALVAVFGAAMAGAGETRVFYGSAAAGAAATGQGLGADAGADAGQGLGAGEAAATEQGEGGGLAAATGAESVADWREVAPAFTNAGEYAVWYKVTNPNYEDFVHAAKVTITKRAVTVRSRSRTKPYDGTPLRLTAGDIEVSLTDGGTDPALPSGEAFVYGDFAERTAAGETEATFTVSAGAGTQLANYALTFAYGTLTVTKATYPGQEPGGAGIAWSVAADAATWVYDGQAHGVTLTGVPAGVTARLAGNAATDAGDYVATAALDYDAANYEPPAAPAPLAWSITPRPVTLMAASKEKPYDGFPLAVRPGDITASGRGYAPGECLDYFGFASLTDVGEIPATFGYRDSATAKVANYAVTVVGGQTLKVTVGGDQISVTADSGTWAYDGAEHRAETWSVHNGDKLLEGHALQVAIDPASVVRTPKDGPAGDGVVSNRFASVRVVETATGADRTRNYNLVLREGVLRVTNACIRSEWLSGTADVEKTYDGAATQAVVTAALLQPATVRYAVGAALPADGWAAEEPSFVHAGTQTVWYAVSADYYEPYTNSLRVAVAPRPVTLATPTKSKTYDGSPLTFGADEVTVGGDGYAPGETFVLSDFASLSDAGRIAARCAYAAGAGTRLADYAVAEDWGTLTVLASADEITVTAADGSWPYDGTAHVRHDYAAENADTLQPGDELVVAFAPESVVLTPEDGPNGDGVVSNVVTSVRVVRNGSEDVTRNYSLAWYPGTLRVTKARIAFDREGSVDPSAFSTSATYDGAGHTAAVVPPALLTAPVTVRYGASADAVALDASPAFTNAGVHTVFYTLDAPYYETYAGTATVTIAPRPVTLVSAGAEKVYDGTPLRADAVRVKEGSLGFVGDEGFAAACRGALTDVGAMENLFDYALTGGALAGNYAVSKEYGWLRVTPATLDPGAVFGGGETDAEGRLVCTRVYNGAPQPFAPAVDFGEPYRLLYAPVAGDEGAYGEAAPTRTHVAEGDLVVYFKFTSPNYAPYYGTGVLRIAPKALTEEMVIADEDAAWFFDGTEKKPSVTVVDGSPNIAAADDWTVAYSDRTGAGLFPVTVTGRNDYCGTVTKEFAILKRPVAPPVIPSRTYSGRLQRPSVPSDVRWTVVANPGGTDAGDYTNVVLRLASPDDYRWKGLGEDETDWTGVFTVRRGANGWSVYPLIRSWTNGVDAASAPAGRPRFGTLSVAYRRRGAPVAEESPERPSAPGRYTARFWAEETANYAGVALAAPYEVDFEIYPGPDDPPAGDATATTPVPVPHIWLDAYVARFGAGDYEAAANAVGANGVALWESYVAGLDPADAASRFTAAITVDADGAPRVTWSPDLSSAEPPRAYTVYGKAGLGDAEWTPVTDANRARMRFFRVQVELK